MTLCVAWSLSNQIHFASDSRISNGEAYSDYGIKVMPIPIKVFSPSDGETGETPIAFEKTYGMCFAGSFTGAYVVREFLFTVLQRLQYIPGWIDLSFIQICNIVNRFYKYLVNEIVDELKYDHSIDFFIAGFCPMEKKMKIAKFFIDYGEDFESFSPKWELKNDDNFIEAIGTGDEDFYRRLDSLVEMPNLSFKILNAMKRTIEDGNIPSVGGNIQYGSFDNSFEFTTSGIIDYDTDEKGLIRKVKHCIAGIDMNGNVFEPKDFELHIMGSFIEPFNDFHNRYRHLPADTSIPENK